MESHQRKAFFWLLQLFLKSSKCKFPYCVSLLAFAFLCLLCKIRWSSTQSVQSTLRILTQGTNQQNDPMVGSRNQAKEIYIWKTVGGSNATLAGSCYLCHSLLHSFVVFIALKFSCWFLCACWYRLTTRNAFETAHRNSSMQTGLLFFFLSGKVEISSRQCLWILGSTENLIKI